MRRVATNVYSRKMSEKPERCGLRTLSVKGSGVVFTHKEGISIPCVRHKRRQPLIKCANMTSIYILFPFYVLTSFYVFIFLWSTRVFPFALTYSSIVMRKSDLRSSFVNKTFWLSYFLSFFARYVFIERKGHFMIIKELVQDV